MDVRQSGQSFDSDTFLGRTQPDLAMQTPGGGEAVDASRLSRGATVGRYVILEQLGEGGMGCVYAAYDPSLDRRIALKLLKPDLEVTSPNEAKQRLLREAQAMARLNHPHVITVHDVGAMGDQIFIAMEMVKGGTLRGWLEDSKPQREVLRAFTDAGEGLHAAHSAGLVHRDFKPENVLIGSDGRVRVTDFGLARSAAEILHSVPVADLSMKLPLKPLTIEGAVMGTPAYMAPEQLAGLTTDARTDQFSFAVALYEALYAERPFAGDNLLQLKDAIAKGRVRPPSPGHDVAPWIRRALLKALHSDPRQRFPSMRELLDAVNADPRAGRRRKIALVAALAAAALAAAGARAVFAHERARCEAQGSLAGVWDTPRKALAQSAFLATGLPSAGRSFEIVSRRLDTLSEQWSSAKTAECLAERTAGAAETARKTQCLQHAHDELDAMSELVVHADRDAVEASVIAAQRLDGSQGCLSPPKAVVAQASPAAVPSELRARMSRGDMLRLAGRKEALPLLDGVVADARAQGLKRLEAEALLRRAQVYGISEDPREDDAFLEAIRAAEAAGDDERVAEARIEHVSSLGFHLGRMDAAQRAAGETRAALTRIGDNKRLQLLFAERLADLDALQGKYDEAIATARKAFALANETLGPQHPDTVDTEGVLMNAVMNAGQYTEALSLAEHNLESLKGLYGPDHRSTGVGYNALGLVKMFSGDSEGALKAFQRNLEIDEGRLGPDATALWLPLDNTAETLLKLGRASDALAMYERALRLIEKGNAQNESALGELWAGIGRSQLALSHATDAVPLLEKALKLREERPGERSNLAENRLALADALWQSKLDRKRAVSLAKSAREVWVQGGEGDAQNVKRVDGWLAAHRFSGAGN